MIGSGLSMLVLLVGCGDSQATHSHPRETAKEAAGASRYRHMTLPGGSAVTPGRCSSARVLQGGEHQVIKVVARCFGGDRRRGVGLVIQRRTSNRPQPAFGLLRYTHRPRVENVKRVYAHGVCQRVGSALGCRARIRGVSTITVRAWVRPRDRCRYVVSVVNIIPPPCRDGTCGGSLGVSKLAEEKPSGC